MNEINISKCINNLKLENIFNSDNFNVILNEKLSNNYINIKINNSKNQTIFTISINYVSNYIDGFRFTKIKVLYMTHGCKLYPTELIDKKDSRKIQPNDVIEYCLAVIADYIRIKRLI